MSYNSGNFTPIEMLPDLEDLENGKFNLQQQPMLSEINNNYPGEKMLPPGEGEKFGRYIRRDNHQMPQQSGMTSYNSQTQSTKQTGFNPNMGKHEFHQHENNNNNEMEFNGAHDHRLKYILPDGSPSCIDVANHIVTCPICSKYYDNNNTLYIVAIIVLSIICILLLKKVLDI